MRVVLDYHDGAYSLRRFSDVATVDAYAVPPGSEWEPQAVRLDDYEVLFYLNTMVQNQILQRLLHQLDERTYESRHPEDPPSARQTDASET